MSLSNKNQGAPGQAVMTRAAQPFLVGNATILYGGAPTGNTAVYFPGTSGDYMNMGVSSPASFDLNTFNLFVEAWINFSTVTTDTQVIASRADLGGGGNPNAHDWIFYIDFFDGKIKFLLGTGFSFGIAESGVALVPSTWTHVAVSYTSLTSAYIFVNGVAYGPTSLSSYTPVTNSYPFLVGAGAGAYYINNGYIRDLRVVKGAVGPTASFTPEAATWAYGSVPSYVTGGTNVLGLAAQYMTPTPFTGTPLFSQLSSGATSSAVGAFSLRAVNGTSAKAVQVRPQAQFPPAAMTSDGPQTLTGYSFGGSGSYVASASLDDVYIDYGFNAFDNNIGTWWHSNYPIYNSGTGIYNSGDARASITGGIYAGEWLQIKMPTPILLISYSLVGRPGFETNRSPRKFWILGSNNDGANWSLVDTQTNINTWASPQVFKTFTISNPGTIYFNTFRIVVNEVGNLTTGASSQDSVQIATWNLVGSPPSADFYADRLGNLLTAPVTGQTLASWLGASTGYVATWYDQSGAGNHATQTTAAAQPQIKVGSKLSKYSLVYSGAQVINGFSYTLLNGTKYTVCAVERRTAISGTGNNGNNTTDNPIWSCGTASGATNAYPHYTWRNTNTLFYGQYGNDLGGITSSSFLSSSTEPVRSHFSMVSSTSGAKDYIYNDPLSSPILVQNNVLTGLPNMSSGQFVIGFNNFYPGQGSLPSATGMYYIGEIYEFIIFNNSLYDIDTTTSITTISSNQIAYYV